MEATTDYQRIKAELDRIKTQRMATNMKWQRANAEKVKATYAAWYEKNKDTIRAKAREKATVRRQKEKEQKAALLARVAELERAAQPAP